MRKRASRAPDDDTDVRGPRLSDDAAVMFGALVLAALVGGAVGSGTAALLLLHGGDVCSVLTFTAVDVFIVLVLAVRAGRAAWTTRRRDGAPRRP